MNIHKVLGITFGLSALLALSTQLIGCGNNEAINAATATAPKSIATSAAQCTTTQVFVSNLGCLNQCNGQVNMGLNPVNNQCVAGTQGTGTATVTANTSFSQTGKWGSAITGINRSVLETLLHDFGACVNTVEYSYTNISYNVGNGVCKNYSSTGYVMVTYYGSNVAQIQIGGGVSNPDYANIISVATGMASAVNVNFTALINSVGSGMQLASGGLIINAPSANFNNTNIPITINYGNGQLGSGTIVRYSN